ncbi:unnamed protein product [Larinioides sclopetarius]|uniref:MATH domain-containing protein n=1 Tax=Larinioides sclopetarius TaxID=280406 RepID=A0AAV2BSU2_9ARAC
MMARPYQRQNIDRRVDNLEGHDVKWDLSVCNLLLLQSWHFKKTYKTYCETSPSTWHFEMWLPEVRDDGTCSMTVRLERIDSLEVGLEACIWIDFCDTNKNLIFAKQTFAKTIMLQGDSIRDTVELKTLPNMRGAIRRNAIVYFTIMICFCHSDGESD